MKFLAAIVVFCAVFYVEGNDNDGYVAGDNNKAYKLVYQSQTWNKAREMCVSDGGKLAIPKTQNEFNFIQKLVRGMYYPNITGTTYKLAVWLGINNLEDYRVWKNIDGENIIDTEFHQWAGENGKGFSDNPAEPHCVIIDAVNPGLRDWWCHRAQPYVCEKPTESNEETKG